MDQDEGEDDDFQTINESELGDDQQQYEEGQILAQEVVPDHSIVKFAGQHKDSVFSIAYLPREPYNVFISGDCDDKALVWRVMQDSTKQEQPEEEKKLPEDDQRTKPILE